MLLVLVVLQYDLLVRNCDFNSKSSPEATTMTFGDLNQNGASGLKGSIVINALTKNIVISENDIRLHHTVCCKLGIKLIIIIILTNYIKM